MGSCFSQPGNGERTLDDEAPVLLPDEVNRLLDRWPIGHVLLIRKRFLECKPAKSNEIDFVGFRTMFTELDHTLSQSAVSGAFRLFDTRKVGFLTFRDVCLGLASTCISSWEVRARFLYSWFELGSSSPGGNPFESFLRSVAAAVNRCQQEGDLSVRFPLDMDRLTFEVTGLSPLREDLERVQSCVTAAQSEVFSAVPDTPRSMIEEAREEYVPSEAANEWIKKELSTLTGDLSLFIKWCCENSQYLYPLWELFEIVPSPERERRTCLSILRSFSSLQVPGSTWHVMSYKWIQRWKSYVHWSERDSVGTVWAMTAAPGSSSPVQNGTSSPVHEGGGFSLSEVVTMSSVMSCTSSVLLQRMTERPSAINNSDIEGELKGTLRVNLIEHHDFVLVPEDLWKHFHEWYGGGPSFPRKISISGLLEMYPSLILVVFRSCGEKHITRRFFVSRTDTCGDLLDQLAKRLAKKPVEMCRLWHRNSGENWELIDSRDEKSTIISEFNDSFTTFMLETVNEDRVWPSDHNARKLATYPYQLQVGDRVDAKTLDSRVWRSATVVDCNGDENQRVKVHFDGEQYTGDAWLSCDDSEEIAPLFSHSASMSEKEVGSRGRRRFLCFSLHRKIHRNRLKIEKAMMGLENIGNTCFMNAIIQCLSSTPLLRAYFLSENVSQHLMVPSKKGLVKLAAEFAVLLNLMWGGAATRGGRVVVPRAFKKALDKFAPRFAGYEHQDAHELLAVLLDGLHEDLNRGTGNWACPSDSAIDAWKRHKAQNASVIADLFDGQQRIDTVCTACGNNSVVFEPFRYVMLPVPVTNMRTVSLFFVPLPTPLNKSPPIYKLCVTVPKSSLVQHLLAQVAVSYKSITDEFHVDWSCHGGVFIAEVYLNQFHRFADAFTALSEFRSDDKLYAYQVNVASTSSSTHNTSMGRVESDNNIAGGQQQQFYAQLVNRRTRRRRRHQILFGLPLVISICPKWTYQQLFVAIQLHLSRFCSDKGTQLHAFSVRHSSPDGTCCSACGRGSCEGCLVSKHSQRVLSLKGNWLYLAIDWASPSSFYNEHYQPISLLPAGQQGGANENAGDTEVCGSMQASLYDCLDFFTAPERLCGENKWFCEKCNSKVEADRKVSWSLAPDILVVLIKRFQFTSAGFEKITVPISFPETNFQLKSNQVVASYDLYGVVNHFGTLSCGHYTALCKQEDANENEWALFNDHEVVGVSRDELERARKSCYVLFYKRATCRSANVINYSDGGDA